MDIFKLIDNLYIEIIEPSRNKFAFAVVFMDFLLEKFKHLSELFEKIYADIFAEEIPSEIEDEEFLNRICKVTNILKNLKKS